MAKERHGLERKQLLAGQLLPRRLMLLRQVCCSSSRDKGRAGRAGQGRVTRTTTSFQPRQTPKKTRRRDRRRPEKGTTVKTTNTCSEELKGCSKSASDSHSYSHFHFYSYTESAEAADHLLWQLQGCQDARGRCKESALRNS